MKTAEEQIKKHLDVFKDIGCDYWIAGGSIMDFLMDQEPNDIDFFFAEKNAVAKAADKLMKEGFILVENQTFGKKMKKGDLVYDLTHTEKTPRECISSFDISVCCAAIDAKGTFYYHEKYFEHVGDKTLEYIGNSPNLNWASKSVRLRKFLKRGFEMNNRNLIYWLNKQESDQKMVWKRKRQGIESGLDKIKPPNQKKFKIEEKKLHI
jgi:hypothetical protein